MTAQPHPQTVFQRGIASGSVTIALGAAAELGRLDLEQALALTLLFAARERPRYGRAAAKWAGRFIVERGPVELPEASLLLALLAALPDQPTTAARGLEAFLDQRDPRLAGVVRRWQVERQPTRSR